MAVEMRAVSLREAEAPSPAAAVAPPQSQMQDSLGQAEAASGGGASLENTVTIALGDCYGFCCTCCAAFGLSANLLTVPQGCVGVVLQLGRYSHTLPPGRHRFNVMAEEVRIVNLKTVCLDVPPQAVMTKDNLTMSIDAVCFFHVFDAQKAAFSVEDYGFALRNLAMVTLRTVLGEHTLEEVFTDRQRINARLKQLIDEASDPWGIKVERVELKAIEIDDKMQRAMAAKAEAQQEAEAKLIQAEAQRSAASVLAEAAQKMSEQPSSLQLQWFETLRIISTQGRNVTIIVPDHVDPGAAIAAQSRSSR